MKKSDLMKGLFFLVLGVSLTWDAGPVAASEESGIALRREAPVYTGPYEEGDLEELTVDDFNAFGTGSESPQDQYRAYRKSLEDPPPGTRIPYRLRIVDRDLALEDFFGFDVPERLSEARYDGYLSMEPDSVDGRTIHYVFVYQRPIPRAGAKYETSAN